MPSTSIAPIGYLDPQQVSAILRLQQIGQAIARNNQQLLTQRRINSAADDPAGLILASNLRSELGVLTATSAGLTQATSLVDTAASAAGQIVSQLNQAQSLALA